MGGAVAHDSMCLLTVVDVCCELMYHQCSFVEMSGYGRGVS